MTAIIMSAKPANIKSVYSDTIRADISNKFTLLGDLTEKGEFKKRKDELQAVDYVFSTWGMFPLTEEEIKEYLPNLKAVFYSAGTVQYFARPFLNLGIKVFSSWAANAVPVIEVASSLIILANKGYFRRRVKDIIGWNNSDPETKYPGNFETKVGLLGAGMIGRGVIEKLKTTDLDIYVFDPFLPDEKAKELGVTKKDLYWIFENCNIISNHLANNEQTKGIINITHLSKMGKSAVFINTGRGAQVVEKDLIKAMKDEPGRLAILDVTDPVEPPVPTSPLYKMKNVIMSPHIAGSIGYEHHRLAKYMYDESMRLINGENTKYEVTLKMLETMA